jgi:hypothetical protein
MEKINIKAQYTLDEYFGFIEDMVEKVFSRKYLLIKEEN